MTVTESEVRGSVFVVAVVVVAVLVRFIELVVATDEDALFVVAFNDDVLKSSVDKMVGSAVVTLSLVLGAKPEVVLSLLLGAKPEVVWCVGTADVSALVNG